MEFVNKYWKYVACFVAGVVVTLVLTANTASAASVDAWSVGVTSSTEKVQEFSKDTFVNSTLDTNVEISLDKKKFFILTNDSYAKFSSDEVTDSVDTVFGVWVQPVNTSSFSARCGILQGGTIGDGSMDWAEGQSVRCELGRLY